MRCQKDDISIFDVFQMSYCVLIFEMSERCQLRHKINLFGSYKHSNHMSIYSMTEEGMSWCKPFEILINIDLIIEIRVS